MTLDMNKKSFNPKMVFQAKVEGHRFTIKEDMFFWFINQKKIVNGSMFFVIPKLSQQEINNCNSFNDVAIIFRKLADSIEENGRNIEKGRVGKPLNLLPEY